MPSRILSIIVLLLLVQHVAAQPVISDSTYLRIPDRAKAIEAIRFDLAAYQDTLRQFRDALDRTSTSIDASSQPAEVRRSRLGQLRTDAKMLAKEMARTRKRMKKSTTPFEELARTCAKHVRRTRELRDGLLREGVRAQP
jgi:septal ring factor EnvC (AmiA/AmiB activator)